MNMRMNIPPLLKPDLRAQRRKTGLKTGKGHMRKQEKTVAHSVLPSDMPRTRKQLVPTSSITSEFISHFPSMYQKEKWGYWENVRNVSLSNFCV